MTKTTICDNCGKDMSLNGEVINVEFNYGSLYDNSIYHYCSDDCLKIWVNKNL